MNSTCLPQSDGSVLCICPDGTGCDISTGFCDSDPCLNNGTCMEITDNFTCSCPPPLTGIFCEVDLNDECDPNPCLKGNCTDLINSYSCTCFDSFTDDNCSNNIDDCDPNPCTNNGSCRDDIKNYFTCNNCTSPWIGNTIKLLVNLQDLSLSRLPAKVEINSCRFFIVPIVTVANY